MVKRMERLRMMKNIKRICIIGGSGTGKTTLSNNLSGALDIPVFHIDAAHHMANWVVRDKKERDELILNKTKEERWIIDGTYQATLEQRLEKADLVIFLDYSVMARLCGVMSRFFKHHGEERPDIPGCREKIDFNFIKLVLSFKKTKRPIILQKLGIIDRNKIIVFKRRRELNKWFYKEFNRKILLGGSK